MIPRKWSGGMSKLGEVRTLMVRALRTANGLDDIAPPEVEDGLAQIKALLCSAIERIEGERDRTPIWPGIAARA
jgi:hypothetical protein